MGFIFKYSYKKRMINYQNIICSLERITKNSWGYTGVESWQLWANQSDNSPAVLEANNFIYFDRGMWYLEIDDSTVSNIGKGMGTAYYTDLSRACDNIKRVANGFLSNCVMGKFNQYCGVKCIKYSDSFYILEGDQADGYCVHIISKDVMNAAGGEVCEAAVKIFIENEAIIEFYKPDGSGYKSYEPIDFPMLHNRKIYDEIMQQYSDYSWVILNE